MSCFLETLRCALCCEEEIGYHYEHEEDLVESSCSTITSAILGAILRLVRRSQMIGHVVVNDYRSSAPRTSTMQESSSSFPCLPRNYYSQVKLPDDAQRPLLLPRQPQQSSSPERSYSPMKFPEAAKKPIIISTTPTTSSIQHQKPVSAKSEEQQKPDLIKKEPVKKSEAPKTFNSSVEQSNPISLSYTKLGMLVISSIPLKNSGDTGPSPISAGATTPSKQQEPCEKPKVPKSMNTTVEQRSSIDQSLIGKHVTKIEEKKLVLPKITTSSVPHKKSRVLSSSPSSPGPTLTPLKPLPLSHVESSKSPSPLGLSDLEKKAKYVWSHLNLPDDAQRPLLLPRQPQQSTSPERSYSPMKLPEAAKKPVIISTTPTTSSIQRQKPVSAKSEEQQKPDLIKKEPVKKSEAPKTFNSSVEQSNPISLSCTKHGMLVISSTPLKNLGDTAPSPISTGATTPSKQQEPCEKPKVPKSMNTIVEQTSSIDKSLIGKHVTKIEEKKLVLPKITASSVPHKKSRDLSSSPSSPGPTLTPLKPLPLSHVESSKSPSPLGPSDLEKKAKYVWVEKGTTDPLYVIPDELKKLIEKDIVPEVLKQKLTPSSYKDYFSTLHYAEDFYIEKWSKYQVKNVTLELHKASIYAKSRNNKNLINYTTGDDKTFVAFKIDTVPERRPFLLSRDFVLLRPTGKTVEPFKGILYRVVKGTTLLAEFGDEFYSQHYPTCKYDVNFSFNRVCLKRSHQAIAGSSNHLFRNFLFPNQTSQTTVLGMPTVIPPYGNRSSRLCSAINNISKLKDPRPYLLEGPLSTTESKYLSETGLIIKEAVIQICRASLGNRILVTALTNSTCDVLFRSLKNEILESDIFRANAAFWELDRVPCDILPFCPFEKECFTCPSLQELHSFKVVLSTFVSSFRLHDKGLRAGHFSHIFLVDASSATEPEVLVVLSNLADATTAVVVTGAIGNRSSWVRSDIARANGLKVSYFERLFCSEPYQSLDPKFVSSISRDE